MLTPAERDEMMTDRLLWLLDQIGVAEGLAFGDIVRTGATRLPALVGAAMGRDADVHVVLAVCGWLPTQPSGGPPFVHVGDPGALLQPAWLIGPHHRAAYALCEDLIGHHTGRDWSPYPTIRQHGGPGAKTQTRC